MLLPIPYEGEGGRIYRDQIVTHDVGVSLHSKTHPLFMKYSYGISTVLCISLSEFVSCAFSTIPICPFLIFHLLVSTLFLLQIACEYFLWSGENTICRPMYTVY